MKPLPILLLAAGLALVSADRAAAQARYNVGDTVANFALTDRATGRPVNLTDFAGKVVLLEWFAWWCPFCQAAAAQIEPGIVRYYATRNGNAAGVPVLHVSVNLQPGQETQTQQFIDAYKLGQVLNDFDRAVANRFQAGGQPIFAVINGVAGSPSHRQWELVFSQLGYGSTQAPINDLRLVIDSVRAAAPTPPPTPPAVPAPTMPTAPTTPPTSPPVMPADTLPAGSPPVAAPSGSGRLINLAVRGFAGTGSSALIPGFVISPGSSRSVLVRAAGPALAAFGLDGTLADPVVAVMAGDREVARNDNWHAAANAADVRAAAARIGAFAFAEGSRDAALLVTLPPGNYSALVSGAGGATGNVLVEVYEVP